MMWWFGWSLLLLLGVAQADAPVLSTRDGWIRPAPSVASVRAGYLVIANSSEQDLVLTSAESPDFDAIELHTMYDDAGTMRMRRVSELRVPAKGEVKLEPGGLHLMMFKPHRELAPGDQVTVTLRGPDAEVVTTLIVRGE